LLVLRHTTPIILLHALLPSRGSIPYTYIRNPLPSFLRLELELELVGPGA
jgi:hypothetical protein